MRILVFVFILINLFGCQLNSNNSKSNLGIIADSAKIEFVNKSHNFGAITEGDTVSTFYEFKNVGTMPLEILNVSVSCGCTIAEKPLKPIGIGQTGKIKVKFNSAGKVGVNKKFITVQSNASNHDEVVSFDVIVNNKQ